MTHEAASVPARRLLHRSNSFLPLRPDEQPDRLPIIPASPRNGNLRSNIMRLPYTIAFGAAAVLVVTPALAQPEERGPFTGIHVEALVGYDRLSGDNSVSDLEDDGITYGAAIGFDAQFGQIIAGVEGELSDSNSRLRQSDAAVVGDEYRLNADRDIYFGARLGYAIAPTTLIYAKGGYTNLRLKTVYDNGAGLEVADGQSLDGWRVAAASSRSSISWAPAAS
jgi:outer membrane immunogenic protein